MSPVERKTKEEPLRLKAFQRYADRLYKPPTSKVAFNLRKYTEASKALSCEVTIAQR